MPAITIKDIARECGVSANTVSAVINNKPGEVSAGTRARVLEAIHRLDYRPNAAARRMVGKRLNTIGIAERYLDSIGLGNDYKNALVEAILHAARSHRWDVLYYSGHPSDEQLSDFPAYLDGRCDGLLCFTGGISREEALAITKTGLPVLFIGETSDPHEGAVLDSDNEIGATLAVEHLVGLGHTRIGMVQSEGTSGNAERVAGFRRALSEAGLICEEHWIYPSIPWEKAGYDLGLKLLSLPASQRPTALFCFNDMVAIGIIRAAQTLGVALPTELSLVGFDDVPPAMIATPALTTLRQPLSLIGEHAVEALIAIIEGTLPRTYRKIFPPELIVRASTTPPVR